MPTAKSSTKRTTSRTRRQARRPTTFQITYANLSSALSDPDMLARFDKAFAKVRANVGEHARTYPMLIGGAERSAQPWSAVLRRGVDGIVGVAGWVMARVRGARSIPKPRWRPAAGVAGAGL